MGGNKKRKNGVIAVVSMIAILSVFRPITWGNVMSGNPQTILSKDAQLSPSCPPSPLPTITSSSPTLGPQDNGAKIIPKELVVLAVVTFQARQASTIPAIMKTWGFDFEAIEAVSATPLQGVITEVVPTNPRFARSSWEEMNALRRLYEKYPKAAWFMKSDDDAYISAKNLKRALSTHNPSNDLYLGLPLIYKDNTNVVQYCAGGTGYVISNSLMAKLYPRLLEPFMSCCSDVQVGYVLAQIMGTTTPCSAMNGLNSSHGWGIKDEAKFVNGQVLLKSRDMRDVMQNAISWHYVTAEMQLYYRMLHTLADA